ncbi:MAG TPA: hypothetical protein VMT28_18130 [Terriglobales bacterium]|jgi:hypothetical protein|nr:hypothetical protein [Terriglobales bacterium]
MSSLGIEKTSQAAPAKDKGRWDTLIVVGLGLVIAFFSIVTINNGYMLLFSRR